MIYDDEAAADAYDAPADDAYGAPADDSYGAPGDYNYDDAAADDSYAAPGDAPVYEAGREARGRFSSRGRGGRARPLSNSRRPSGRSNRRPSRPSQRGAAQERRRGRGLIPIPVPHRGPARNRLLAQQAARSQRG